MIYKKDSIAVRIGTDDIYGASRAMSSEAIRSGREVCGPVDSSVRIADIQ